MTNEEKLKQIFPDGISPYFQPWLKAEYKENTLAIPNDTDLIRRYDAIEAVAASDFTDGSTAIFCGKYIIELLKGIPGVQSENTSDT